jgi:hypothetical protein
MKITEEIIKTKYFNKKNIDFITGHENAIVGIELNSNKVCYSVEKLIDISMENGKSFDDAVNHVRYNLITDERFFFVDDIF